MAGHDPEPSGAKPSLMPEGIIPTIVSGDTKSVMFHLPVRAPIDHCAFLASISPPTARGEATTKPATAKTRGRNESHRTVFQPWAESSPPDRNEPMVIVPN